MLSKNCHSRQDTSHRRVRDLESSEKTSYLEIAKELDPGFRRDDKIFLIHLKSVDSTNNYALKLARDGAAHGTVVWADEQTAGRGQFDRKWTSEPGKDLLASFIVRPKLKAKEAAQITLKAAELIRNELLDIYQLKGSDLTIKAPNDILLRGNKVSGILTESSSKGEMLEYAVIGVGINLNSDHRTKVADATSFCGELSKTVEIEAVLKRLSDSIFENINESPLERGGAERRGV